MRRRLLFSLSLIGLLSISFLSIRANADHMIELLDKTKITGRILHYYDGMLTLKVANGSKMSLPQAKIRAIHFALPKARKILSTPEKAFKRLREAALKGDITAYIDTHSTYYQMLINHQIAMASPKKFRQQLKKQWGEVQLKIIKTKRKGSMATMKVRSQKNGQTQDGEFHFVRENGEWKMILPL